MAGGHRITSVSRTVGETQVVDELILTFTHGIVMDAFLPGVAPTGRHVEIGVVVVVGFRAGLVPSPLRTQRAR